MLEVKNLSKNYGIGTFYTKKVPVLKNISFSLRQETCTALIGESGCGKSTLARLLLGLEKPDTGTIFYNGQKVTCKGVKRRNLYRYIQPVFQDSGGCLNPRMKVRDCICEPLRNYRMLPANSEQVILAQLLMQVELSANIADKYPHELSGGQQKRVCIARAISIRPKLLIFDEAVAGLDATITKKILQLLKKLQVEVKCGIFFITHDLEIALYMAQQILVMKNGEIVEEICDVESSPNFTHPYSQKLFCGIKPALKYKSNWRNENEH